MKILGIVAEYDPFHNGHLFHITKAKQLISPDYIYIALSPCFKQRGELSLLSPIDRAMCALRAGANAVFCLPVVWTVRDAQRYALGAVSLLSSLGVTHLAFGAETPDAGLLSMSAEILESPTPAFSISLKKHLASGCGYPFALSAALGSVLPAAKGLLDKPNNTLAVCYLRAIRRLGFPIEPVIIPRSGSYHADTIDPSAPSASSLRESLLRGCYSDTYSAVPAWTADLLRMRFLESRIPDETIFDSILLTRLRIMNEAEYNSLPDLSEGMENALRTASASARSLKELTTFLTGKRYTSARICRLCASALLGITKTSADASLLPQNALLLGLRTNPKMTSLWKDLPIPVISSFSDWKKAAHPTDLAAWRLWAECCRLPDTLPFSEKIIRL